MKTANYAPIYAGLYPELAELCKMHGYALAIHGSMARDFDLVCIPWVDNPSTPDVVVDYLTHKLSLKQVGEPELKAHGRLAYTLTVSYGECFIDLSFMGAASAKVEQDNESLRVHVDVLRRELRSCAAVIEAEHGEGMSMHVVSARRALDHTDPIRLRIDSSVEEV